MQVAKNIFKTSFIYFIGQILTKLISFLLLPLYTNYVAVADFGFYDLSISVLGVVVPVIFMEVWTATLRFSLEKETNQEKKMVINNTLIIAIIALSVYLLLYIIVWSIMKFDLPIWIFAYSFFWLIQLLYLNIARSYGHNSLYASSGVISVFVNCIATITAVIILDGKIETLYIGVIASFIVQVIIIESKLHVAKSFTLKDFDINLCKELALFSFPLSFNSVIHWMLEGFNKIFILAKLGEYANGIYAIGNRLSTVLNLVVSVFLLSWQETIFKITSKSEKANVYDIGINTFIKTIGCALALLLPIVKIAFPYLIGNNYSEAENLIPLLLMSIAMNAICSTITPIFSAEKATKYSMYSKVMMCIANALVILLTIDIIGLYASPIALIIANCVGIISQVIMARKYFKIHINKIFFSIFVALFIVSSFSYYCFGVVGNLICFLIILVFSLYYLKSFITSTFKIFIDMIKNKNRA